MESLVLHHGDGPWNAPTRLRDLFRDSAPDTHRVASRLPPDAPPPLLRRLAARKFGSETAEALASLLERALGGERIYRVAAAIVDCEAADDFLARARGGGRLRPVR